MQVNTQVVIAGARKFKDTVEGKQYDFTKVYVEEPFDTSKGDAIGGATVEFRVGDSNVFAIIAANPLPCIADVTINTVARGGKAEVSLKINKIIGNKPQVMKSA